MSARLPGAPVILGVSVLVFVITRLIGDPVNFILPLSASQEQRDELRASLGFDDSIFCQFGSFAADAIHLDFGESTYFRNEGARHRDALPPQDAAAGRRRDEHRLLHLDPARGPSAAGRLLDKTLVTGFIGLACPQFFIGQVILLITSVSSASSSSATGRGPT